jgi:hypothetical protein
MDILIAFLSLTIAGFMLFDGLRALIIGDYIRPKGGDYAGKLGPWSVLVSKLGIDPESKFMKWVFVAYGIAGIIIIILFLSNLIDSSILVIYLVCTLWYLTIGTILSVTTIILILVF